MPWARIDDSFHDHGKIRQCSLQAIGLWVLVRSWTMRHQTDTIPKQVAISLCHQQGCRQWRRVIAELCASNLWEGTEAGYRIHDNADYLPQNHQIESPDEKQKRKNAVRQRKFREQNRNAKSVTRNVTRNVTVTPYNPKPVTESVTSNVTTTLLCNAVTRDRTPLVSTDKQGVEGSTAVKMAESRCMKWTPKSAGTAKALEPLDESVLRESFDIAVQNKGSRATLNYVLGVYEEKLHELGRASVKTHRGNSKSADPRGDASRRALEEYNRLYGDEAVQ